MTYAKKYQSIGFSCLLHGLLLLLIIYAKVKQQEAEPLIPQPKTPAQVVIRQVPPPSMSIPIAQSAPAPAAPVQPLVAAQQQQTTTPAAPLDAPIKDSEAPAEESSTEYSLANEPQEETAEPASFPTRGSHDIQGVPTPRKSGTISKEAFMKAFSSAVQEERTVRTGHLQASSGSQSVPHHVQAQLQAWSHDHYLSKIQQEIKRAGKFTSRYLHLNRSFEGTIYAKITINKDGSLRSMDQSISGIAEVDEYIRSVINRADLPPIPDRFGMETFALSLPINVSIKEGSNTYYFN